MIPNQARRTPHQGAQPFHAAPNAALLIDFDNVTMGIRSDLGKELKSLLNSDVIRGKVAVQRAYADWRRYPQYIVPLAESSIDLIFAPAYGSSKKNATDLRMAIDAMELVFTRPEIGTFILMTGDSDFSSCVLKLKEYGKYVIGVGMRESSSDLLIQNCDEYYSYHSLSGLTRAGEVDEPKEDPWVLLKRAAQQMAANNDVMRTDRLKQVMLELEPAFDEKKLGYSKFSRFVTEAASKGLLKVRKGTNGQYEIAVEGAGAPTAAAAEEPSGNGRGRRDRGRSEPSPRREAPAAEKEPAPAPKPKAPEPKVVEPKAAEKPAAEAPQPAPVTDLQGAYALLQQAVRTLAGRDGQGVRDGDVKRKMLDLVPGFDETELGFSKFTRFLRQAHDAEIVDLSRVGAGNYEVSLSASGPRLEPPLTQPVETTAQSAAAELKVEEKAAEKPAPKAPAATGALRGRRTGRAGAPEGPPPILPGQVVQAAKPAASAPAAAETAKPEPEPKSQQPAAEAKQAEKPAKPAPRGRRGGRRGAAPEGPPPILPGQTVSVPTAGKPAGEAPAAKAETAPAASGGFDPAALNLPRDRKSIHAYLTNSYRGVGKKTAESLLDAFGEDVFLGLEQEPDRVREVLGDRRAGTVLEQWSADLERRRDTAGTEAATPAEEAPAAEEESPKPKSRTRRGGRGGRGRKKEPASTA